MTGTITGRDLPARNRSPRIATLAIDELTARRIGGVLAAEGLPVTTELRSADGLADSGELDLLVGVFGSGLTDRERRLRNLRRLLEETAIVVVIPADSRRGVRRTLEVGAEGVVFEAQLEVVLAPTVRAVLAGQIAIPTVERGQFERPALSFREKEVLRLTVVGMSNKEISATLFLAESTVKCHLSSAFGKLGVRSRNEAADLVLNEGRELGLADLAPTPMLVGAS